MLILEKGIDYVIRALRIVGGVSLSAMMLLICADVVLRAFGYPIYGGLDMVQLLSVAVLACALPYTHQQKGHVGVDLVVQKFSSRSQAIIDSIMSFISMILWGLVAWQMWIYGTELASKGEVSMTIGWPVHPFMYLVAVCFGLMSILLLVELTYLVGKAVKE